MFSRTGILLKLLHYQEYSRVYQQSTRHLKYPDIVHPETWAGGS